MKDSKIYGISSCLKFAEKKTEKIVRAFFSKKVSQKFSKLMKQLADRKKVYRIVDDSELEKLTKSMHHEGVCFVVDHDKPFSLKDGFFKKRTTDLVVYLDGVSNPHNLGAIMRVCSHFGVRAICHSQPKLLQSGAAIRTSEGGFESLDLIECTSLNELLKFAKDYSVFSTSSHKGRSIILLFGEEGPGLSAQILDQTECVQIPGTGSVESLNVATATAVLLAEIWRQRTV
jgi:TrmH RNA methyltransferase